MIETIQFTINGIAVGCIYGLVALGFVLIYKAGEVVNFAQGEMMMLGAMLAVTLIVTYKLDYWLGLTIAIVLMMGLGALIDATVVRRIVGFPQFSTVMLTLGLGFILRSAASFVWGPDARTLDTPFSAGVWNVMGVTVSHTYASLIIGTFALCSVLYIVFKYTRIGNAMQAASENQLAAYYMGIPVKAYLSLVWAISAGVSTCAGVLLAPVALVDVNMGSIGLKAFAAAVVGGFGSIPGALVGGIVIGLVEIYAGIKLDNAWRDASPYLVLLAVLLVMPKGIFGSSIRKKV